MKSILEFIAVVVLTTAFYSGIIPMVHFFSKTDKTKFGHFNKIEKTIFIILLLLITIYFFSINHKENISQTQKEAKVYTDTTSNPSLTDFKSSSITDTNNGNKKTLDKPIVSTNENFIKDDIGPLIADKIITSVSTFNGPDLTPNDNNSITAEVSEKLPQAGEGRLIIRETCSFCGHMRVYRDDRMPEWLEFHENLAVGLHHIKLLSFYGEEWNFNVNIRENEIRVLYFHPDNAYGDGNGRVIFITRRSEFRRKIKMIVNGTTFEGTTTSATFLPEKYENKVLYFDIPQGYYDYDATTLKHSEITKNYYNGGVDVNEGNKTIIYID